MTYCIFALWRDGNLSFVHLAPIGLAERLPSILAIFVPFVIATTVAVYRHASRDLFGFVRNRPLLWAAVMIAYPVLSVYPQGIIYRTFLFERYRALFPNTWLMVVVSALAFTFVHIVFRNWIALVLTALGGVLFAMRYAQTGSLFISSFEHALYGCWIFTVGLGKWFFYEGQWKQFKLP